ncbi:hypothetical protein Pst134EA_017902 [Puccinia striiformis f. sp. tritici]|uniref:hypothetical protein n=1 Tax=Puccinia striiformis f. sp. tritici TaxID=168172 RepID=UPI0020085D81|nr:hypothetical protein Pst134EA_017902 [Puccinia striiformis f. sp. tritici]KAH9461605.1 hypothetical protein Pst134EA_017902 [Puccinia striiformis f. sp. tritici]
MREDSRFIMAHLRREARPSRDSELASYSEEDKTLPDDDGQRWENIFQSKSPKQETNSHSQPSNTTLTTTTGTANRLQLFQVQSEALGQIQNDSEEPHSLNRRHRKRRTVAILPRHVSRSLSQPSASSSATQNTSSNRAQPQAIQPATPASTALDAAAPAASAEATLATHVQSANDDQPSGLPVAPPTFNLGNSSIVVSVPVHTSQVNHPLSAAAPTGQSHHTSRPKSSSSNGGTFVMIAILIPVVLVLLGALMVLHRVLRRKRERRNASRAALDDQIILPESRAQQHQMGAMTEKHRFSTYRKSPYAMMDDDLSKFAVSSETRPCPPLPPSDLNTPGLPSTSVSALDSLSPIDPAKTAPDLSQKGGTQCRMNCVVARTFAPTMSDELIIGIDDRVLVFMLFDDGWCLGENLDFDKHHAPEGYSRTGVLPQDCLTGLNRLSIAASDTSGVSSSWKTAADELCPPGAFGLAGSQEVLASLDNNGNPNGNLETLAYAEPVHKPQRNSSLLCDRETQLLLELESALAFS